MASTRIGKGTVVADPPLARFLFSDTRMAPVWLLLRIYVGWAWLEAGWHKVQDVGATSNYIIDGAGILSFWNRIAAIPAAPASRSSRTTGTAGSSSSSSTTTRK